MKRPNPVPISRALSAVSRFHRLALKRDGLLSFHVTSTEGDGTVQVQNVYGMGCRRARGSWGCVDKGLRALSITMSKIKACVTKEEQMLLVG